MDTRPARDPKSAIWRRVCMPAVVSALGGVMSAMGGRSVVRLAVAFSLMFAMLFGPTPDASASVPGAIATDTNDHASEQHPLLPGGFELVAEAEESRDEVEERAMAPVAGLLNAGWSVLAAWHPVASGATWWVGRPRLGGAGALGRGPPARV